MSKGETVLNRILLPAYRSEVVLGQKEPRQGLGALGQAGTKGPDSRCFEKVELAGLADRLNEGVKKRDRHIQIRKPDHKGLRNLLWTLSQPQ